MFKVSAKDIGIEDKHGLWRYVLKPAPWIVLLISLSISVFASFVTWRSNEAKIESDFDRQVDDLSTAIEDRMRAYASVLHGAQGLYNASVNGVTREEFRRYDQALDLSELYPGIQGLGFAELVPKQQLSQFENSIKAEGFPEFEVSPRFDREIYTAIKFIEPFDWRNKRAFGYDMYSNEVRKQAMDLAWQTGETALSGPVVLLQETSEGTQYGFLMYLGFYGHGDKEEIDPADLEGWVYAAFRVDDLMRGLFGDSVHEIMFELRDVGASENLPFHQSNPVNPVSPRYSATRDLFIGGRDWRLIIKSLPNFEEQEGSRLSMAILIAGLVESISLFLLALAYVATRDQFRRNTQLITELGASDNRSRAFLNSMSSALLACDHDGEIVEANKRVSELIGYSRDELIGMNVDELLPRTLQGDHRSKRKEYARNPRELAMARDADVELRCQDGKQLPVEIGLNPVEIDGQLLVIANIVDISRQKSEKLEREALLDELSQKNSEMEQFVYSVSHDLKSPLVSIRGFNALLQRQLGPHANDRQIHWFARISENLDSMETLLTDLLELSRIIHKGLETNQISISKLLKSLLLELADTLENVGAEVESYVKAEHIVAQQRLLGQAIINLVNNAIQYRSSDRPLKICVRSYYEGDWVVIQVTDNGIGIDERYQDKVFKLFERLDPEHSKGNGIGLAIVKSVVDKHGGKVLLNSKEGEGSSFSLYFPSGEQS